MGKTIAKKARPKKQAGPLPALVIELSAPGMTPLFRAGVGGLAASLRALHQEDRPRSKWPAPVELGPGTATVESSQVVIEWGGATPEKTLQVLFSRSFRIRKPPGSIDLPGAYDTTQPRLLALAAAEQGALKRTFLQHGKSTTKAGAVKAFRDEIDGQAGSFQCQPYSDFVHQKAWIGIAEALPSGSTDLAGWAYPGAAQRHIAYPGTKCEYTPVQALCGCFAIVGCLSFLGPVGAGVLVVAEPADLVSFSEARPRIGPKTVAEIHVCGVGDAVLAVEFALRLEEARHHRRAVAAAHGVLLRTLPWARQQKSRSATVDIEDVPSEVLDVYDAAARKLPTRIRVRSDGGDRGEEDQGYFAATSALRGFVADNLASGREWFEGFAQARAPGKDARFIHQYRSREGKNLGALFPDEKGGLIAMLDHLQEAESVLVRSVHVALRQRFGAIAAECRDTPATMKKRFEGERAKWRLAFAGSKTAPQIRAALADLWSRAGSNSELQTSWEKVLPLLRDDRWQAARDLALVALASYQATKEEAAVEAA